MPVDTRGHRLRAIAKELLARIMPSTVHQTQISNATLAQIAQKLEAVVAALDNQQQLTDKKLNIFIDGLERRQCAGNEKLSAIVEGIDNQQSMLNSKLGALVEGIDNLQSILNSKLGAVIEGIDNQSSLINDKLNTVIDQQPSPPMIQPAEVLRDTSTPIARRCADAVDDRSGDLHKPQAKIFICRSRHEHDRIYTENLLDFFRARRLECGIVEINPSGQTPRLQKCLDAEPTLVLGYNSQLDHSWLPTESFLAAAADRNVPVIQWILDHPSSRWIEFNNSTAANSRFLLNTKSAEQYFHRYCLPEGMTAAVGGVGPSSRSRVELGAHASFTSRPIRCLIPLSLKRTRRTMAQTEAAIAALDAPLASALRNAHASALHDLMQPLEAHLAAAFDGRLGTVPNDVFNTCVGLLEDSVQAARRKKIFEIARAYPVLVQSDPTATPYFGGATAACEENVSQEVTLSRMKSARAVLSVSPLNDLVHDRTLNGLNAGCVNIIEDNLAHRGLFQHGKDALLFRYDDDSLHECLETVCYEPKRAYEIARAGIALRDSVPRAVCAFDAILDLARR